MPSLLGRSLSPFDESEAMTKGSIYRERTIAWYLVAALVFGGIGTSLLFLGESDYATAHPKLKSVISNLGGLTIASLGIGIIWELVGKRALIQEVFESASVSREIQQARIFGVTTQFQEGVQWPELLAGAHELELMIAVGRTWRNTLDHSLSALAARPGSKITAFFPDPDDEDVVEELSKRFPMSAETIVSAINSNVEFFKGLADKASTKKKCQIAIWYLREAPLYTFYRIDEIYILSTYRHGPKGNIPTFVCRKGGCIADFIEEQKALMTDKKGKLGRQVYPVATKAPSPSPEAARVSGSTDE